MSDTAGEEMSGAEPRPDDSGGVLARATGPRSAGVRAAGAGIAAAALYLTMAFAPFFLIPVQVAFGRRGRRGGMVAAGTAALVIASVQAIRLAIAKALGLVALGATIVPPVALLGALVLVNAAFWSRIPATYRILAVAAACALAMVPVIDGLGRDASFIAYMEARLDEVLAPLSAQKGALAGDQGYDGSALAAALDPKALTATTLRILVSSYAAILVLMLGGSWWIGNRASGPGRPGRYAAPALSVYRVPYAFVWAFLVSWAVVLAAILARGPGAFQALAWNCAIAFSLPYAAQGVGIASSLFDKWKMPRFTRVAIAATAIAALVTPTAGTVVAVALPLLGVTEVWIPYRNPKGVGA